MLARPELPSVGGGDLDQALGVRAGRAHKDTGDTDMKRSVLALAALAACATAAQAADSVTIYGGVDGNVTRVTAGGKGSIWQLRDGGMYVSKLGFTGIEDLGGGLRANFVLESQSNSDTGAAATTNTNNLYSGSTTAGGLTWNRKATVSLITPYGEARLGRDYTSTFVPATYFDPFFSAGVSSAVNFQPYYAYVPLLKTYIAPPTLVRASNMVGYYIPSTWVPGMYAYAQVALSEGVGAKYEGLGAGYRTGPLFMAAALGKTKNPFGDAVTYLNPATTSADNTLHVWSAGASYDISGFRLMGFYHSQKVDLFGQITSPVAEQDHQIDDWMLGFSWAIGVNTIKAAYMKRNDKGAANMDSSQIGLGYSYYLSKRTALYAQFVNIKNTNGGSFNFLSSGFTPNPSESARAIQAGISHSF
jgi:predicted porin